jgi:tetraacyldisaccharide 4'-kinase
MTRRLLAPLGWVYGACADLRNAAFDRGILRTENAGVPVISVGNLTAGGSGKTPLVEHIVRLLLSRGASPGVISRGYGRQSSGVVVVSDGRAVLADAREGGDEPVQIAHTCRGVRVVVGERRVEAARTAVAELGSDVLVMDDGFQHRHLRRAMDIVVIDSRNDPFEDRLLPAGMLRERPAGLRRATMVALSRSDSGDVPWREKLVRVFQGPVIAFIIRGERLDRFSIGPGAGAGAGEPPGILPEGAGPLVAFSGIGDHTVFVDELRRLGFEVAADRRFADHHWYSAADASVLAGLHRASGAAGFVTTQKDAVRLRAVRPAAAALESAGPVFTLAVAATITRGAEVLDAALDRLMRRAMDGSGR